MALPATIAERMDRRTGRPWPPGLAIARALVFLLCAVVSRTQAQRVTTRNDALWISHWGDHRICTRWSVHTEAHWRRVGLGEHWQQLLLRPAVNLHMNELVMFTLGYSYYDNHPYGTYPARFANWEHHLYQQVQLNQSVGPVRVAHRIRMEERFIARLTSVPGGEDGPELDGYQYQNRVRYRVWITVPLGRHKKPEPGCFTANMYDEVFLNFGDTQRLDYIQQNRISALLGYQVSKPLQLMAGHLFQNVQRPGAAEGADLVELNSTWHFVMVLNLDLRKKENDGPNDR